MKLSNFSTLLTLAILMVVGVALIPHIDVADQPRPQQGKTLSIWYSWPGASAKVVEQNVTSRIEGLVSAVRGVERVTSESYFGSGRVNVELKKNADVSATKFEIASLLRQVRKQLPEGVSYPELSGGEVVNESRKREATQVLLSYRVNSNLSDEQLKEYIERQVEPQLRRMEEVKRVEVTGGSSKYIIITYDPFVLAGYGLSAADIENGIKAFLGKCDVVGKTQAMGQEEKHTLYLTTEKFGGRLEEMPIGRVDGKTVYLNDLATYEYKDRLPGSYYRVNGLNTIYLNIHVDAAANKIKLSRKLRERIGEIEQTLRGGVYLTLTHDGAKEKESELQKLIGRSMLSLAILLVFVWLVRRDWRYLSIMTITLAANLVIAAIAYCVFDIRLHIYSLAGITVSLGMVIDASVVMVDHYSYYHDRKAFMAILAALLTTIAALIVVLWLPDFLQRDLYDFAWIIIINLSVALVVAYLFAPALIEQLHYHSRQQGRVHRAGLAIRWGRLYERYIRLTQRRKWVSCILLVLAFGIPFHLFPSKWGRSSSDYWRQASDTAPEPWYAKAYNVTFGSDFFQRDCKEPLSKVFGGTMRLFAESLSENTYSRECEKEIRLNIRAQMPLGGTAAQLNEKVVLLENFLATFPEIERFETRVEAWGASVTVEFREEAKKSSFPYLLENKVIGKVISIGGADWSTSGVSERGFSNSLNLQYRTNRIEIVGYNYDRLYRIAEDICDKMRQNNRVVDIMIETPGHEHQEDELYMHYDKEKIALYGFDILKAHNTLREVLSGKDIDRYRDTHFTSDIYLRSAWQDKFDLWRLDNSMLRIGDAESRITDFMRIEKREAKNCIPRQNQEYVLHVAFNILGSYTYSSRYVKSIIEEFSGKVPVGYRCQNASYGSYQDDGAQYWLLGLIVVIIFFVCSILFESLRQPLAIISLIPVSFIGTFLTYYLTGLEFGTGGFASMVLLCGLTVNAGIYILCEYNNQRSAHPSVSPLRCYLRAYNHKVIAVFLTTLSTVLGLVPFYIDGTKEPFWFSFAVGSTGGLLFSVLALVLVMPVFVRLKK
ncbi:MAG: efflux RND transporter permease subunit [Bacteroidaceae bacterium]|nr:efflux RND transporter permease subunit [Bacteroidaceae bacterium]